MVGDIVVASALSDSYRYGSGQCQDMISGFEKPEYKKFNNLSLAIAHFMNKGSKMRGTQQATQAVFDEYRQNVGMGVESEVEVEVSEYLSCE